MKIVSSQVRPPGLPPGKSFREVGGGWDTTCPASGLSRHPEGSENGTQVQDTEWSMSEGNVP
jgi:hypothetical protein